MMMMKNKLSLLLLIVVGIFFVIFIFSSFINSPHLIVDKEKVHRQQQLQILRRISSSRITQPVSESYEDEEELMTNLEDPEFEAHMNDITEDVTPEETRTEYGMSNMESSSSSSTPLTLTPPAFVDESTSSKTVSPPDIVHFYGFPQSGATHFMYLIQQATQKTSAINYGHVKMNPDTGAVMALEPNEESVRLKYPSSYPNGKEGPSLFSPELDIPSKYILTRTQGDAFCVSCHPNYYVSNVRNFAKYSFSGTVQKSGGEIVYMMYDPKLVKKAIHLYQDPFMNIVSRFKGERQKAKRQKRYHYLNVFPDNQHGFNQWCGASDRNFWKSDRKKYPKKIWEASQENGGVLCRQEFFKYIQWHNNAEILLDKLKLDEHLKEEENHHISSDSGASNAVLNVHYKDFVNDRMEVIETITDFLEQDVVQYQLIDSPLENLNALDYFTQEEIDTIKVFMSKMAIDKVWQEISIYPFYDTVVE